MTPPKNLSILEEELYYVIMDKTDGSGNTFHLTGSNGGDTITYGNASDTFIFAGQPVAAQDFWYEDGFSLTGNPSAPSPDTISFNVKSSSELSMNNNNFWKYNEDKILKQLEEYLASTYSQHYVDRTGGGKEQTLDKIKHNRREGFCAGNVTKYIDRYDVKGTPRQDLFKVLHYTMLLINHLDLIENK